MGTRSTVKMYNEADEIILAVYQQYDGYIEGVGHDLANWLKTKTVINGFGTQTMENFANGMGCLAAQYVAKFKEQIGGFYITTADDEETYNYEVRYVDKQFNIKVKSDKGNFDGTPDELLQQNF